MSEVIESFRTLLGLKLPVGAVAGKFLKSDVNGVVSWADMIPAGTKTIFYQGTAPDGWFRDTSMDDAFFRIVGGAWTGGLKGAFSNATGSIGITQNTGSTTPSPVYSSTVTAESGAAVNQGMTYSDGSGGTRGGNFQTDSSGHKGNHQHLIWGSGHAHNMNHTHSGVSLTHNRDTHKYVDMILCEKDV